MSKDHNIGYDAQMNKYTNMLNAIIDPTKVVRTALQDAASAGLLITTEAMVADAPEDKPVAMPDMGAAWAAGRHGMGGMM